MEGQEIQLENIPKQLKQEQDVMNRRSLFNAIRQSVTDGNKIQPQESLPNTETIISRVRDQIAGWFGENPTRRKVVATGIAVAA